MALLIGLHEARCFNFRHLCIEGDSYCAVQWAGGISNPPWYLADILEEVIYLSKSMKVSFHHIKPNSNGRFPSSREKAREEEGEREREGPLNSPLFPLSVYKK